MCRPKPKPAGPWGARIDQLIVGLGWKTADVENHFGRKTRAVNRLRFNQGRIRRMPEFVTHLRQLEACFAQELEDAQARLITVKKGSRIDWRFNPLHQRPADLQILGPQTLNPVPPKIVIVARKTAKWPTSTSSINPP